MSTLADRLVDRVEALEAADPAEDLFLAYLQVLAALSVEAFPQAFTMLLDDSDQGPHAVFCGLMDRHGNAIDGSEIVDDNDGYGYRLDDSLRRLADPYVRVDGSDKRNPWRGVQIDIEKVLATVPADTSAEPTGLSTEPDTAVYVVLTDDEDGCMLVRCTHQVEANEVANAAIFSNGGVSAWLLPTLAVQASADLTAHLRENWDTNALHEWIQDEATDQRYLPLTITPTPEEG